MIRLTISQGLDALIDEDEGNLDALMEMEEEEDGGARRSMGFTENNSATYLSSSNPCVDFFFQVVPDTPAETLTEYLQKAWDHNPLTALKLICNLRGVRGTGKSDKEGYYTAALWLHSHHPKTLACNVASMAGFGYFKDLPEILFRLLEGADVRKKAKEEHERRRLVKMCRWSRVGRRRRPAVLKKTEDLSDSESEEEYVGPFTRPKRLFPDKNDNVTQNRILASWRKMEAKLGIQKISDDLILRKSAEKKPRNYDKRRNDQKNKNKKKPRNILRDDPKKKMASDLRHKKKAEKAKKAAETCSRDPAYKHLFERVSDFFAGNLKKDIELLKSGDHTKISLAAKWCPSLDSSYDRATLLCESIARKVFPKEMYEGIEDAHYAYRVRDRLRKEVLVPLRKALELPEVYMGANDWGSLPYRRVASVAMTSYQEKFLKHDKERFEEYLEDVKTGKAKIAAGALLPHEIIKPFIESSFELRSKAGEAAELIAELQWRRIVDDLSQKGKLNNCIAVCDVSGSMSGEPMEVCVALGMLVSELSEEPWKGKVITFSASPTLQRVEGESLREKVSFVQRMEWGMSTDFQKVFDRILDVAVEGNLNKEDMIKRVLVFSDMEFDQASSYPWETDYEVIARKFGERGYGDCVPEIVFWNLRSSRSTPVESTQEGVALVSGFSKNLLTLFLDDGEVSELDTVKKKVKMDPESVMEAAIAKEEYQKLVVYD